MNCPCHSNLSYEECCKPYHEGKKFPSTPEALMRSRYSAYALDLPYYIIETTSPKNPHFTDERARWIHEIRYFFKTTQFDGLIIEQSSITSPTEGFIIFRAILKKGKEDVSFREKSYFEKVEDHWLYVRGETLSL